LIQWIKKANTAGARLNMVCHEAEISVKTYKRWRKEGKVVTDQRTTCQRPVPTNKLTEEERQQILTVCHQSKMG